MSGALTTWAIHRDDLSPSKKLILAALCDESNNGGWVRLEKDDLVRTTGLGRATVYRLLKELREEAYLVEGKDREGFFIQLGVEVVGGEGVSLFDPASRSEITKSRGETEPPEKGAPSEAVEPKEVQSVNQSARARQTEFAEDLRDAEVPDQLLADGKALLREGRKVDGKIVTGREMAVAVAGLAEFNRQLERDFGVGANLTSIVMRARDRPSWAPADHVRLVALACEDPWWERKNKNRRPTPNVIWGDRSFENVVQDAADRKAGKGPKRYRGRTR